VLRDAVRPLGEKIARRQLAVVLSGVRQILGGGRSENLYLHIREAIQKLPLNTPPRLLDFGCGSMALGARLYHDGLISAYLGVDTFIMNPESQNVLAEGCSYQQVSDLGQVSGLGKFDVVMLIDVIHHITPEKHAQTLRILAATSSYVLVKDHFEEGMVSRTLLRLADWFGNYAYGVSIPRRYFSKVSWQGLLDSANLEELIRKTPLVIHNGLFGRILPSKYHFISVLKSRSHKLA